MKKQIMWTAFFVAALGFSAGGCASIKNALGMGGSSSGSTKNAAANNNSNSGSEEASGGGGGGSNVAAQTAQTGGGEATGGGSDAGNTGGGEAAGGGEPTETAEAAPVQKFMFPVDFSSRPTPTVLDAQSRWEPATLAAYTNSSASDNSWFPVYTFYVAFDGFESDDVLIVQHYTGWGDKAKKWGEPINCETPKHWDRDVDFAQTNVNFFTCRLEDMKTKKTGKFSVRLTYRQTGMGKDHENIRTYEYEVKKNRYQTNDADQYYIDHDAQVGDYGILGSYLNSRQIKLNFWMKVKDTHPNNDQMKMRCFYQDKKIAELNGHARYEVEYEKLDKKDNKTFWKYQKWNFAVTNRSFRAEIDVNNPNDAPEGTFYLAENPGDYKCTVTFDGKLIRELTWTIGEDGKIVQPDCISKELNLPNRHAIIKVTRKDGPEPKEFDADASKSKAWWGVGTKACGM